MIALRVAGAVYLALGIGFGAGALVTLLNFARHGELPMTPWGFRSMSGPFEGLGAGRFSVLGWSLVAVCALDAVAGNLALARAQARRQPRDGDKPLSLHPGGRLRPAVPPRRSTDSPRPDLGRATEPAMSLNTTVQGELDGA